MSNNIAIAIDGPAGAGKSTIARLVAERKGYIYVDTGAMYRAMALYFIEQGIGADEQERIASVVPDVEVTITYEDGEQIVWLGGRNVNGLIRTEEVGKMASASSGEKACGASAGACQEGECRHGRQGYRNVCPAGRRCEGISDCGQPCESQETL